MDGRSTTARAPVGRDSLKTDLPKIGREFVRLYTIGFGGQKQDGYLEPKTKFCKARLSLREKGVATGFKKFS